MKMFCIATASRRIYVMFLLPRKTGTLDSRNTYYMYFSIYVWVHVYIAHARQRIMVYVCI